jgi:Holliday junction resolvase
MDGGLRQLFKMHLPEIDWQAVDVTGGRGVPDSNGCHDAKEFWIEHKMTHGRKVGVRPEQVAWIERRLRHGGKVFIAVRRVNKKTDDLYLLSGSCARALASGEWPYPAPLGHWSGGPTQWDWQEIKEVLLS